MSATILFLSLLAGGPPGDNFGSALVVVGDVDGDRIADWAVSDPWGPGVVEMRSGASGKPLWSLSSPGKEVGWGQSLAPAGDWDADGTPDLAVACAPGPREGADVLVVSGKDGATIFAVSRQRDESWKEVIAGAWDFDRDGMSDLLLARGWIHGAESLASLEAWSGKRRERLWEVPDLASRWLGDPAAAGIDFTADGIGDVVAISRRIAGNTVTREIVLLSGQDGTQVEAWSRAASRAIVAVDVSRREGRTPRIVAASTAAHESRNRAHLDTFERGRPDPVWSLDLPDSEGDVDVAICARHDIDGDGVADVVVGQRMANLFSGRIDAYSGEKGGKLWAFENSTGEDFGYAVCAHPDLDGDGVGDYLVSASCPYNSERPGAVVAVTGRTGRELYRVGRTTPRKPPVR